MMGLPTFVRRQLGAASSPSTDLISPPPPRQDMGKDNLVGGDFGRSWLILCFSNPITNVCEIGRAHV